MKRILANLLLASVLIGAPAYAQQGGGMGGAGFGGGMAQDQRMRESQIQRIDQEISTYLNGEEIKAVLTPGEYCEWPLKLKTGQVVFAEASSDAFDPALEVVDSAGKQLAANDDRYPGDQRPLLAWRCPADGDYALHVRCFHDKSGGQFTVVFKTYMSVDVPEGQKVEKELDTRSQFLLRIPMKAGEIVEIHSDSGGEPHYVPFNAVQIIGPGGLPNPHLTDPIENISPHTIFMAPVAGDYYALANPAYAETKGTVKVWTEGLAAKSPEHEGSAWIDTAPTGKPSLWVVPVKAGEFLQGTTAELFLQCRLDVTEAPDVSKYDVTKPESNPFYPQAPKQPADNQPVFDVLPARARDDRKVVIAIRRDAKLWFASNGFGPFGKTYTLKVQPAAEECAVDRTSRAKLRVADTDYWAFDAKAGDAMSFSTSALGFTEQVIVRDPNLNVMRQMIADPDQTSDSWKMIVQHPGRYLISVSCMGAGGGGDYSLTRTVLHAKEFDSNHPAKSEISAGQIQIWKFAATPNNPMLVHWTSSNWAYDVAVYNEKGEGVVFQHDSVDAHNQFGILNVQKPQTYVIVLTGRGPTAKYEIALDKLPGYRKGEGAEGAQRLAPSAQTPVPVE